ncbi:MAG: DUF6077 domain-containing protein [Acetatifactor sp.]|nr:DUF6077 domain-containing protein [Acetatifactor sp.]
MLSVVSLVFWLAVIPFCIGLIPAAFISSEKRSLGVVLLAGYFGMWALFELAAVPAVLWVEYRNFRVASAVFTVLSLLGAAAGVCLLYRNARAGKPGLISGKAAGSGLLSGAGKKNDTIVTTDGGLRARVAALTKRLPAGESAFWILFFVLLGFQLYKAVAFASFDGDDAYYVVESLIAQEADVMYRILPLTGGSTGLDVRHAMAVFPMWVAFVSVRAGVHATIVSHVVMPVVLIPLTYLLYHEIGRILFGRTGENLPVFMIIMALFQIFGNVSLYTNETFFLTRTWQGKAVAGSLVIPALLWVFLQMYDKGVRKGRTDAGVWMLLVSVNMTAGVCSSIAVFLVCLLTAVTAFCLAVAERDWKVLFKVGAACTPSVVYMAVYVIMAYGYLL